MIKNFIFVILILSLVACSAKSPVPSERDDLQHTVSYKGENLGRISEWYTGSFSNWQSIAARNPHIVPLSLKIGEKVYVPSTMLMKTEKMPKTFLDPSSKRAASAQKPTGSATVAKKVSTASTKLATKKLAPGKTERGVARRQGSKPEIAAVPSRLNPSVEEPAEKQASAGDVVRAEQIQEKKEIAAIDAEVKSIEEEGKAEPLNSVFVCRGGQCNKAKELPDTVAAETEVAEIAKATQ